ncbi:MAG: bifunctional folylpolyglutamate synthase/dihydrofolate synthase [Rhodothermia bacterium]|nr:bifunctional folylpolyglutamate synthase/dihydrofolate synthase [Rhodothermia bacterium]
MEFLLALPRFADRGEEAYRPGLDRIRGLLAESGNPQRDYPIIHVGGTNGKGSVASFAASILTAAGLRTGLHTSPHLLEVGERMRVDGTAADEKWLAARVAELEPAIARIAPSFFEVTVALSLLYFSEKEVDAAVVEVGLGGRLDATNIVDPIVSVITNVSLDHTDILGDTIEQIAAEKAGIIKPRVPIITGAAGPAESVLRQIASDRSAPYESVRESCRAEVIESSLRGATATLHLPDRTCEAVRLDLPMNHQIANALLGARSAQYLLDATNTAYSESTIADGIRDVRRRSGLKGRFEILAERPLVIADVAHNVEGISALVRHVQRHTDGGHLHMCIALMKDKDASDLPQILADLEVRVLTASVDSARARGSEELSRLLKHPNLQVDNLGTVSNAIEAFFRHSTANDVLIVTGSHLVVADALRYAARQAVFGETPLTGPR